MCVCARALFFSSPRTLIYVNMEIDCFVGMRMIAMLSLFKFMEANTLLLLHAKESAGCICGHYVIRLAFVSVETVCMCARVCV